MGSYSVESDGPAVVDQGETILDPNAASTVRDAGTPTSGPVNGGTSFGLAGSGASFGISGLPNFYGGSGAADQGASLPSFDGSSAFGQGANGMSYQSILPTFLGNTMTNLPNPNQIVARNWMKLDPGTQDLFKAAYEQQGYSPEYIDWQIKQILPKAGFGAAPRSQGRIMR